MLPTINNKSLLDCSEEDLQTILDASEYSESLYIDYKESFEPDAYDSSKKKEREKAKVELRNDVCAFANAEGGFLIFGVKEKGGIPQEIVGISVNNRDTFERNIKTYLQPIMPRMPSIQFHFVELKNENIVVILFIQHDFFAPYIHLEDEKNYRVYKRVGNSKAVISYAELKNMFVQSLSIEKEIERFRKERIAFFQEQSERVGDVFSKFVLLHIIPETFLDSNYDQPVFVKNRSLGILSSIFYKFGCGEYTVPMVEGVRNTYRLSDTDLREHRVYNNGILESFSSLEPFISHRTGNDTDGVLRTSLLKTIEETVIEYSKTIQSILPVNRAYVCITIIGAKGVLSYKNDWDCSEIDRNTLICNPVLFLDLQESDGFKETMMHLQLDFMLALGIRSGMQLNHLINELYS